MYTFEQKEYLNPRENINITHCKNDRGCNIHTHEFVELIYIVEGTAMHVIDGQEYAAEMGNLLFVNYGQTHSFTGSPDYEYYNLLYVPEFFSEELINSENIYEIFEISMFREFKGARDTHAQLVHFKGNEACEVKKLVENMNGEFVRKETGYRSILNGYSRVLFSKILRKLKDSRVNEDVQKCINHVTIDLLSYIDTKCFEKITLKEIAAQTFYNPAYLSRLFRAQYGISLSEYIKKKRMEEAAKLLIESDLNNEEIMNRVGYTDRKQFYKSFKEIYHLTPTQFRKREYIYGAANCEEILY